MGRLHGLSDALPSGDPMMLPEERYRQDPYFHMLVDMIEDYYRKGIYSPSEIREAAMLACIHHEMKTVRPFLMDMPRGGKW